MKFALKTTLAMLLIACTSFVTAGNFKLTSDYGNAELLKGNLTKAGITKIEHLKALGNYRKSGTIAQQIVRNNWYIDRNRWENNVQRQIKMYTEIIDKMATTEKQSADANGKKAIDASVTYLKTDAEQAFAEWKNPTPWYKKTLNATVKVAKNPWFISGSSVATLAGITLGGYLKTGNPLAPYIWAAKGAYNVGANYIVPGAQYIFGAFNILNSAKAMLPQQPVAVAPDQQ